MPFLILAGVALPVGALVWALTRPAPTLPPSQTLPPPTVPALLPPQALPPPSPPPLVTVPDVETPPANTQKSDGGSLFDALGKVGGEIGKQTVVYNDEVKDLAGVVGAGTGLLMTILATAGGIAAMSGPGAALAVAGALIAANVVALIDVFMMFAKQGEWNKLDAQLYQLREVEGRYADAQTLFTTTVIKQKLAQSIRTARNASGGDTSYKASGQATKSRHGVTIPWDVDMPAPASPAELRAHPEQMPTSITLSYGGQQQTHDVRELLDAAKGDIDAAREHALTTGAPGYALARDIATGATAGFLVVGAPMRAAGIAGDAITAGVTYGARDVRADAGYAHAVAQAWELCELIADCCPWVTPAAIWEVYFGSRAPGVAHQSFRPAQYATGRNPNTGESFRYEVTQTICSAWQLTSVESAIDAARASQAATARTKEIARLDAVVESDPIVAAGVAAGDAARAAASSPTARANGLNGSLVAAAASRQDAYESVIDAGGSVQQANDAADAAGGGPQTVQQQNQENTANRANQNLGTKNRSPSANGNNLDV